MPVRVSLLMSVTTAPVDKVTAAAHSGGWSESFYVPSTVFQTLAFFQLWATFRARLLADAVTIIGYRQQLVTISGNKLLPGGTAAGTLNVPGAWASDLNAPQDSLMLNFQLAAQPQNLRHRLPGLPDSQVTNGEYQPTAVFKGNVTNYINSIASGAFSATVRDLSQPDARVQSLQAGVLTTLSATGAIAGQYIRLRRVVDSSNLPVEGTFLVLTVTPNANGTVSYTLFDPPAQTVNKPNGTCRLDALVNVNIISGNPNRLVIRKVGRPFVQYRGRRSKRRV